jgi:hypothetical protein
VSIDTEYDVCGVVVRVPKEAQPQVWARPLRQFSYEEPEGRILVVLGICECS